MLRARWVSFFILLFLSPAFSCHRGGMKKVKITPWLTYHFRGLLARKNVVNLCFFRVPLSVREEGWGYHSTVQGKTKHNEKPEKNEYFVFLKLDSNSAKVFVDFTGVYRYTRNHWEKEAWWAPGSEHPIMHNTSWVINLSLHGRGDPLMGVWWDAIPAYAGFFYKKCWQKRNGIVI